MSIEHRFSSNITTTYDCIKDIIAYIETVERDLISQRLGNGVENMYNYTPLRLKQWQDFMSTLPNLIRRVSRLKKQLKTMSAMMGWVDDQYVTHCLKMDWLP